MLPLLISIGLACLVGEQMKKQGKEVTAGTIAYLTIFIGIFVWLLFKFVFKW